MVAALRAIGIEVEHDVSSAVITVQGCSGVIPSEQASLYVANSGTSLRFLTAMLATGVGNLSPRRQPAHAAAARSPTCSSPSTACGPGPRPTSVRAARR